MVELNRSPTPGTPAVAPSPARRSSAGVTVVMERGYGDHHPVLKTLLDQPPVREGRGCRAGHSDHATCHGEGRRRGGGSGSVGVTGCPAVVSAGAVPRARPPSRHRTADTAPSLG